MASEALLELELESAALQWSKKLVNIRKSIDCFEANCIAAKTNLNYYQLYGERKTDEELSRPNPIAHFKYSSYKLNLEEAFGPKRGCFTHHHGELTNIELPPSLVTKDTVLKVINKSTNGNIFCPPVRLVCSQTYDLEAETKWLDALIYRSRRCLDLALDLHRAKLKRKLRSEETCVSIRGMQEDGEKGDVHKKPRLEVDVTTGDRAVTILGIDPSGIQVLQDLVGKAGKRALSQKEVQTIAQLLSLEVPQAQEQGTGAESQSGGESEDGDPVQDWGKGYTESPNDVVEYPQLFLEKMEIHWFCSLNHHTKYLRTSIALKVMDKLQLVSSQFKPHKVIKHKFEVKVLVNEHLRGSCKDCGYVLPANTPKPIKGLPNSTVEEKKELLEILVTKYQENEWYYEARENFCRRGGKVC